MTGLFSFDGPLYKDRNGVYCSINLTDAMFSRYFQVVDRLVIMVRTYRTEKTYQELNLSPLSMRNIKVAEIGNFNSLRGFLIDEPAFEKSLPKYLERVDLVFARMPSNISNSVLKVARKMQKPYLVEVGGDAWDSFWNHGAAGKLIAPVMYGRERKNVAGADFATYVTKNYLQRRYPNHHVTANCSNVYLEPADSSVLEERLARIKRTDFSHLIFGQALDSIDVKYKGAHLFVKAMGTLKKEGIRVEYQLAGSGTGAFIKRQADRYGVADQVKLLGTLRKEEVFKWLKKIDIYVQPSKQEGLPRSVIEAMSMGCPAIGSDIAGIPELLDRECLFHPDRNQEIVAAVKHLMTKDALVLQAERNFKKAKTYNLTDLERSRRKIFMQYRDYVENLKHRQKRSEVT